MIYDIHYAYFCHKGKVRYNNEDNYWCCGDSLPVDHEGSGDILSGSTGSGDMPVLAVFDGMGGESCGEAASGVGAQELGRVYEECGSLIARTPKEFLSKASERMNKAVCDYAVEYKISSMGSTMVSAAFGEKKICLCNLGDSRAYIAKGKLEQVSTDHVSRLSFWGKAPLVQYLGLAQEDGELAPSLRELPYEDGMRILLCTDGLTDMLSQEEIGEILLEKEAAPDAIAGRLLDKALEAGGRDNVTAVVCSVSKRGGSFWKKRFWAWLKGKKTDEKQDG